MSSITATAAGGHGRGEPVRVRRTIQTTAVLTLVVTVAYLGWRASATVPLHVWWLSIPLLLLEVHAAVGLALHAFSLWHLDHVPRVVPATPTAHRVAVLIATYDEPEEVLLPTIAAAVALRPHHETWVLDDGGRPWVEDLARSLGAHYLARDDRHDAKAGNLNNALTHVDADLIAVLDADHVAAPDLLRNTLGYFADPGVALVQTPQAFYNRGSFEDVRLHDRWWWPHQRRAFHEQELFYRAIQPGKNRWSAAFWCGTGAVLRVQALADVGGVATGSVTEDIHTTIRLHRRGWRTVYHNEILAEGLAASTAEQYMLQRRRWCTGAMQVLRAERPLTGRGLTLVQRLAYAATLLGWFDAWRTLGYVLLPMLVVFTGASPIVADLRTFAVAFGTTFALQQYTLFRLGRGRSRPLLSVIFELVRMPPTLRATLHLLRPRGVPFDVTPKGRHGARRGRAPWLLVALLVASVAAAAWYVATLKGATPVSYAIPEVAHVAMLWLAGNAAVLGAAVTRTIAQRFAGERRASYRFRLDSPASLNGRSCRLVDLSLTGARVEMSGGAAPGGVHGEPFRLVLGDETPQHCTVRTRTLLASGDMRLGLEFVDDDPVVLARLALWAFRHRPHHAAPPSGIVVGRTLHRRVRAA